MPPILWTDVTGMFPNDTVLAAVPVAAQTLILSRVEMLSATFFGGDDSDRFKLARIYLAAHTGLEASRNGAPPSGPLTGQSEGGASESFAVPPILLKGSHSSTQYGVMFDDLVRSSPYRVGVMRCGWTPP